MWETLSFSSSVLFGTVYSSKYLISLLKRKEIVCLGEPMTEKLMVLMDEETERELNEIVSRLIEVLEFREEDRDKLERLLLAFLILLKRVERKSSTASKESEVGSRKTQYPSDYDEMVGSPHSREKVIG